MIRQNNTALRAVKSVVREADKGIWIIKYLLLSLIIPLTVFACKSDEVTEISLSEMFENNELIDPSTLTPDQRKSFKKLALLVIPNLKYQDGKVSLNISRKDLTDIGFAAPLYDKWNQELAEINLTLSQDTISRHFMDEEFDKKMKESLKELEEW